MPRRCKKDVQPGVTGAERWEGDVHGSRALQTSGEILWSVKMAEFRRYKQWRSRQVWSSQKVHGICTIFFKECLHVCRGSSGYVPFSFMSNYSKQWGKRFGMKICQLWTSCMSLFCYCCLLWLWFSIHSLKLWNCCWLQLFEAFFDTWLFVIEDCMERQLQASNMTNGNYSLYINAFLQFERAFAECYVCK